MLRKSLYVALSLFVVGAVYLLAGAHRIDHDRFSLAQVQLAIVESQIEVFRADTGRYPLSLDELIISGGPGQGPYLRKGMELDPWRRPLFYRADIDGHGFTAFSLGRDGRLGGEGADADIAVASRDQMPRK